MISYSVRNTLLMPCYIYPHPLHQFPDGADFDGSFLAGGTHNVLLLIDCADREIDGTTKDIMTNPVINDHYVAYYNLPGYSDSEGKAVSRKVRGFFYTDDSMELFLKGIRAIFDGEIWISRQILLRYVMSGGTDVAAQTHNDQLLTEREQQILSLVSVGVDNEEIGEKLCISVNTVKTHMYNIFKKIHVTNRLQAALWAAKNL
jgi:LuxR family transcriptional regulator of csgAB operon